MKYAGQRHADAKVHWRTGWRGRGSGTADADVDTGKKLASRISKKKGYHHE